MTKDSKRRLRPLAKVHPTFVQAPSAECSNASLRRVSNASLCRVSNASLRRVSGRLRPEVLSWMWQHAEILSEGEVLRETGEAPHYLGSTMISIDLSVLVGKASLEKKGQLMTLLRSSLQLKLRCTRLALQEARRRCSWENLGVARTEMTYRGGEKNRFFIDVDIEIPLLAKSDSVASMG